MHHTKPMRTVLIATCCLTIPSFGQCPPPGPAIPEVKETKSFIAPIPQQNDFFGTSVDVYHSQTLGTHAIVGAIEADGLRSGSAYVYFRDWGGVENWGLVKQLIPLDAQAADDEFGISVSLDSPVAVVGVHKDDDLGPKSGSAYIFLRDEGGPWNWGQTQKLLASDGADGDNFGFSVSYESPFVLVGSPHDDDACPADPFCNSGSAYLFQFDGTNWVETAKFTASDAAAGDEFGYSVSVDGAIAVVGSRWEDAMGNKAGAAYVFRFDGMSWTEEAKLTAPDGIELDEFGNAVAAKFGHSGEDDIVVIGAHLHDCPDGSCGGGGTQCLFPQCNPGSAYVFKRNAAAWQFVQTLRPNVVEDGDRVGSSVSISGEEILVGSKDSAFVFHGDPTSGWAQTLTLTSCNTMPGEDFGVATAISNGTVFVGAGRHTGDNVREGEGYAFSGAGDCDFDGVPDACEIANGTAQDCNGNGVPDYCDITILGTSQDVNVNGIPDECEIDCNLNGVPDDFDILAQTSADCNLNGIPDECEVTNGVDIVFIIDTSGSMILEGSNWCAQMDQLISTLTTAGITVNPTYLGISEIDPVNFPCLVDADNVFELFGGDLPLRGDACLDILSIQSTEDWVVQFLWWLNSLLGLERVGS